MTPSRAQIVTVSVVDEVFFEGRPLRVLCDSTIEKLSWWKEGVLLAEANGNDVSEKLLHPNVSFTLDDSGSFVMEFSSLVVADSATYTCTALNDTVTHNDSVDIVVHQRNNRCVAQTDQPLEYLAGEMNNLIFAQCWYPAIPNTNCVWVNDGVEVPSVYSNPSGSNYTNLTLTFYIVTPSSNGTVLTCLVNKNNRTDSSNSSSNPLFSCSIGPIYIYENPFVRLNSSSDSAVVSSTDELTLCCRIFPATIDVIFHWNVSVHVEMSEIVTTPYATCVTIAYFNVSVDNATDVNATCRGDVGNTSYVDVYRFTVEYVEESTTIHHNPSEKTNGNDTVSPPRKEENRLDTLVLVIIILSVIVVALVVILLQLTIWCWIRKCNRQKNPTSDTSFKLDGEPATDNLGFDHSEMYNDIVFREDTSMSPVGSRQVEITDEEIHSSDETIDEPGDVNMRFKRQSTVSTFSDAPPSYSFVTRGEESTYHDLPPLEEPIYARAKKGGRKRLSRLSTRSYNADDPVEIPRVPPQKNLNNTPSIDEESGISISDNGTDNVYFDLPAVEMESTQC